MTITLKYARATFLLLVALLFALERHAYTYADRGPGPIIFQALGAICSGTVFYFRRRIRCLLLRGARSTTRGDHAVRNSVLDEGQE
jgi:hypothetical protein